MTKLCRRATRALNCLSVFHAFCTRGFMLTTRYAGFKMRMTILDLEERAEMVLEYMQQDHPDSPATAEIRVLVEKIRNNED